MDGRWRRQNDAGSNKDDSTLICVVPSLLVAHDQTGNFHLHPSPPNHHRPAPTNDDDTMKITGSSE